MKRFLIITGCVLIFLILAAMVGIYTFMVCGCGPEPHPFAANTMNDTNGSPSPLAR